MKETNQNKKTLRHRFQEFITKVTFNQMPAFMADYLLSHLSGNEFKVMYAIARQTYGWFKFTDKIAGSKLASLTDISKSNIHRYTKSLETKGYLTVNRNKSNTQFNDSNEYTINADYIISLQKALKSDEELSCENENDTHTPILTGPRVVTEETQAIVESSDVEVIEVENKPKLKEGKDILKQNITDKEKAIKVLKDNKYEIRDKYIYRIPIGDRRGHYCEMGGLIEVNSILNKSGLSLSVISGIKPYKLKKKK